MPKYEVEYESIEVTVTIAKNLHPYLIAEARRRKLPVSTVISQIVNEDMGRKRIQSCKKDARLPNSLASGIAK